MLEYFRTLAKRRGYLTEKHVYELKRAFVTLFSFEREIDVDTASEVSIMLHGAEFLSDQTRARIDDIIHAKIEHSMPSESVANSGPKSKFRKIENYLTAPCWEVIESQVDDDAQYAILFAMDRGETTFCEAAMAALHTTPRDDMPRTRATEICGAICPECAMIEARPGCCIEPRGHENEHYCGKCGCSDTSDFWQGAMSDTSSDTSSSDTSSTSPPSLL